MAIALEVTWTQPDEDLTYNQTLLYKATSKFGTYALLATITNIRTTKYVDTAGTSTSWYKLRFYDSTAAVYSDYSQPVKGTVLVSISLTNYTTPKKVMQYLNHYRPYLAESVGTGDASTKSFTVTDTKMIADTEIVYVAGTAKIRNVDYTTDYDLGKFTFGTAPASGAITADYWASSSVLNSQVIDYIRRAEDEINRRVGRSFYPPQTTTEYIDSFDPIDTSPYSYEPKSYSSTTQDFKPQTNDFLISRVMKLEKYPIVSINQIILNGQLTSVTSEAVGTGTGAATSFSLDNGIVVYGSEFIYLDGVSTTAYTINYETGAIVFSSAPGLGVVITSDYNYADEGTILAADEYLTRSDNGIIMLKKDISQIKQSIFNCAVTYTYGCYEVPAVVEDLATRLACLRILQSTMMGSIQPLDVTRHNIEVLLGEIRGLYETIGRKMEATRI